MAKECVVQHATYSATYLIKREGMRGKNIVGGGIVIYM